MKLRIFLAITHYVILAAMFASLTGKFLDLTPTRVTVDCGGTGYDLHISLHTYSAIQAMGEGRLYTYLRVAEDALTLYGFATAGEKETFLKLISVSGVGANTARMMLSSLAHRDLVNAVSTGDIKTLESIKGIGKKTAERIVLELRDKIGAAIASDQSNNLVSSSDNRPDKDALEALVALGISRPMAETALNKAAKTIAADASVEVRIKAALKLL